MQHVHMVTFCSVVRGKHELLKHRKTRLNLQIMWNGQSQREDSADYVWNSRTGKTMGMEFTFRSLWGGGRVTGKGLRGLTGDWEYSVSCLGWRLHGCMPLPKRMNCTLKICSFHSINLTLKRPLLFWLLARIIPNDFFFLFKSLNLLPRLPLNFLKIYNGLCFSLFILHLCFTSCICVNHMLFCSIICCFLMLMSVSQLNFTYRERYIRNSNDVCVLVYFSI